MSTLSVCMIAKNEAACIEQALSSIREIAQEIIVVDTGSTDRTVSIARDYGAEILRCTWREHFAKVRNTALSAVRCEWVLNLDADEYLEPSSLKALSAYLPSLQKETIYNFEWQQSRQTARTLKPVLFSNGQGIRYLGRVHETPWHPERLFERKTLDGVLLAHSKEQLMPDFPYYQRLLKAELESGHLPSVFHAKRHLAQSYLIQKQDHQARLLFERAWELWFELPKSCSSWGYPILNSLLFLAFEHRDSQAYQRWRLELKRYFPNSTLHRKLPLTPVFRRG